PGERRHESRRQSPVRMQHVERTVVTECGHQSFVLLTSARGSAQIANRRTGERVGCRLLEVAEHVDEHLTMTGQAFDERQQGRNHVTSARVEPAGYDQRDAHGPSYARSERDALTSLRQGYGGPPKGFARWRKGVPYRFTSSPVPHQTTALPVGDG